MASKIPVAWIANDGRVLRVYPSLLEASRNTPLSETTIKKLMTQPDSNYRKPTLKDLQDNYVFERSICEVNNELAFLMYSMMEKEE